MTTNPHAPAVDRHYGRRDLGEIILAAVRATGKDPDHLSPEDLAPATEFHSRGREATRDLARLAGLRTGMRVLDVGGGLGGPARTLASEFGCRVTVLDLTEEYCRVGAELTARTGLGDRVDFRHGNALDMPFPDGEFEVVWTQHSSMNVADKERLYAEIRRVLRSGGRFAMHEIMAGAAQPIHFPVPWARDPALSLRPSADLAARVRSRLCPWAPTDVDLWDALRWAGGRAALPAFPRLDPDWGWHCAPLSEWDGMRSTAARSGRRRPRTRF